MTVSKLLKKVNTRVLSLLMFYENRKNIIFKVLSSIVYCIMENFVFVDYLCCLKTKLHVTCKRQVFENRTYNAISGIGITELLMNTISCHGFANNKKSDVILSCSSKFLIIIFKNVLFFSKIIQMPLNFAFTC